MVRVLLLFLIAVFPEFGNSCAPNSHKMACELLPAARTVFRVKILERFEVSPHFVLCRARVEESFKGPSPDNRTVVLIEEGFSQEQDYLVFDVGVHTSSLAPFLEIAKNNYGRGTKALPRSWGDPAKLVAFNFGGYCSHPVRLVDWNGAELKYLRAYAANRSHNHGSIQGFVTQNTSWSDAFEDSVPAQRVKVNVRAQGSHWTAESGDDGTYRIDNLAAGKYEISVERGKFLAASKNETVTVPDYGCVAARSAVETRSSISGVVVDSHGRPASSIELNLAEIRPDGTLRIMYDPRRRSDPKGRFTFEQVPMTRLVLGSNIEGYAYRAVPYDQVFAPAAKDPKSARVFDLKPGSRITGLTMRLPPVPFGTLWVDVQWPDGTPATNDAKAEAFWNGNRLDWEGAPKGSNRVGLFLPLNRTYEIGGQWMGLKEGTWKYIYARRLQSIEFKKDGQVARATIE